MTPSLQDVRHCLRRLSKLSLLLTVFWLWALWWGERSVFESSLRSCEWQEWERWPSEATPHHVVLIADPQLVDPHTYPGRPWPLSSFTIWYTDLYLRRSYRLLQEHLQPETVFFLGDLFDGGREWGTATYTSPEKRYKRYGNKFWLKEYGRFARLFFRGWKPRSLGSKSEPRGHKIISSLPGNHDLGFASGIKAPVKDRFETYFGPLNRVDVVGNHTFISIDTVSLSAMDQVDPATGSSGLGDGTAAATASTGIWKPVEQFLTQAKDVKAQAIQREHMTLSGTSEPIYTQGNLAALSANITSLSDAPKIQHMPSSANPAQFPTILLSHVPLYRPADTPCGPLRERGNALSITAGYQYQNVLTPLISKSIISNLGSSEVAQIYSGDDHDYCEIEHLEFTGRIKEVTVKSMSWAMGVRRPGFLAVSLHNPIDLSTTSPAETTSPKDTIQNHLCLLPDQLAIFIRYAQLLGITLITLSIRAILYKSSILFSSSSSSPTKTPTSPILPFTEPKSKPDESNRNRGRSYSSSKNSSIPSNNNLSTRGGARSSPPTSLGGYGNLPPTSRSSSPLKHDPFAPPPPSQSQRRNFSDGWSMGTKGQRHRGRLRWAKLRELRRSVYQVALPVVVFYFWLLWSE